MKTIRQNQVKIQGANKMRSITILVAMLLISGCASSSTRSTDSLTDVEREKINTLTLQHGKCLYEQNKDFKRSKSKKSFDAPVTVEGIAKACDGVLDKIGTYMTGELNLNREYVYGYVKAVRREGIVSTEDIYINGK